MTVLDWLGWAVLTWRVLLWGAHRLADWRLAAQRRLQARRAQQLAAEDWTPPAALSTNVQPQLVARRVVRIELVQDTPRPSCGRRAPS